MAFNYDYGSTTATSILNSGLLGSYASQQNTYTQLSGIQFQIPQNYWPVQQQQAAAMPAKPKRFLDELRAEIADWHGDVLMRAA